MIALGGDAELLIADAGRVRVLTLNRPGSLNAFTESLYDAVAEALIEAKSDRRIAVVVLTGTGTRAFTAGVDVKELAGRRTGQTDSGVHGFPGFIRQVAGFPKPFICAVNGLGVGVGATVLMHADYVVMSHDARIRCPFTDLGLSPEAASTYLLPRAVGRQRAADLLFSSRWLAASECLEWGIAGELCAAEDVLTRGVAVAQSWARKSVDSLMAVKRCLVAAQDNAVEAALAREAMEFDALLGGPANLEGLAALAQRRAADFPAVDEMK